jgi:hypothetical protein
VAISRITGVTASNINAGATTLNYDESLLLTNDLILVAWSCGDDDFTQPTLAMTTAGYAELTTSTLSADGGTLGDGNLAVFYKYFVPGDVSAVTAASGTGTDSSNATACQVFRGVATVAQGGPLEIPIQVASGTTGGDPDPPSVSGFDEATAVVVIAGASSKATSSNTFTAPAGYATNFLTVGSAAETFCAAVGLGYREDPGDPENPAVMTSTGAAWCAATMVLKEAPAAPASNPSFMVITAGV